MNFIRKLFTTVKETPGVPPLWKYVLNCVVLPAFIAISFTIYRYFDVGNRIRTISRTLIRDDSTDIIPQDLPETKPAYTQASVHPSRESSPVTNEVIIRRHEKNVLRPLETIPPRFRRGTSAPAAYYNFQAPNYEPKKTDPPAEDVASFHSDSTFHSLSSCSDSF